MKGEDRTKVGDQRKERRKKERKKKTELTLRNKFLLQNLNSLLPLKPPIPPLLPLPIPAQIITLNPHDAALHNSDLVLVYPPQLLLFFHAPCATRSTGGTDTQTHTQCAPLPTPITQHLHSDYS